nr:MAG TPA: Lecithin retinol acyltransferase [Caudoviricetes sp.]DAJ14156.1 MAG TPA: Lecithin retinol acyltransferase [Podoviridae sp. ctJ6o53]
MIIQLYKKDYAELLQTLIEKVLETERLYAKIFENCKHRSGWCKRGDCKHCEYTR